ncbi:MAG: PIN domain-containing protein [Acidobacteriota bacterium]
MKTAVDSSILLDVLGADRVFGPASLRALRAAYDRGALLACEVVWAEVSSALGDVEAARAALDQLGVRYDAMTAAAAEASGTLWRDRPRDRASQRSRVIADFLIGAHALDRADALLTRDRGFFRQSFRSLRIIDPARPG